MRLLTQYKQLKLSDWALVSSSGREIILTVDEYALAEERKLEGCYVLKTDLADASATKEIIHNRYKDLALGESAFRTSKTVELEMRPIHVRLATRTRGHAFVVMMAYRIVQELSIWWQQLDLTVEEGIKELSSLCATEVLLKGVAQCNQILQPRESVRRLLEAADVRLPEVLPSKGIIVTTKKKLPLRRKIA